MFAYFVRQIMLIIANNFLMPKQSAISDNLSIELEQPAMGDNLTQEFIHLLIPPEKNSNSET